MAAETRAPRLSARGPYPRGRRFACPCVAALLATVAWGCAHVAGAVPAEPPMTAAEPAAQSPAEASLISACTLGDAAAWLQAQVFAPPAEGRAHAALSWTRAGEEARVVLEEQDLPDDAVAARSTTVTLRWRVPPAGGVGHWRVESCQRRILRCWRGAPRAGRCP